MDKCVLIVDDNDFNRELVKDILEDEDITVYEAEDGSSAIELLESEQADDIDVVLMDMRMPGMDGIETTKIICPTIGTHSGPGTVALFFMGEPR